VQNWEAEHQVMAAKKNLQFVTHIDPALPTTLYGDPDRITQVATNLITNALKFTDQGSVTVTVSYNKTEWTISVADTGIGIPEHAQAYIFDAFRQGDSSTTREHGGTGLGLSIVHNLCALMGGSIAVTSKPGSGSTFTVHLPLMTQALAE
jgi:signal transduction histidine kinase